MTRYKYKRYLGDHVDSRIRVPRQLYERVQKASSEARQSFNQRVVALLEREFGDVVEEAENVVPEK